MSAAPILSGVLVIFGITGDLTRKKLLPALYHLTLAGLLPEHFEIVGLTRRGTRVEVLLDALQEELRSRGEEPDHQAFKKLARMMRVITMDMSAAADFHEPKSTLDDIEAKRGTCLNRLFYLSIPPHTYGPVIDQLGESGLGSGCQHSTADSRIMVEKPFGRDLASAEELISRMKHSFAERQIYRIDHYLAKETAQNILTFRFSNPIFEAIWDHQQVESIEVTASETIGIEGRAAFYDPTGALRDLIQSHLLQLLTLATMEQPARLDAAGIRREKLALLNAVEPIAPNQVHAQAQRAQYEGYTKEVDNADSITETFARIKLAIDTPRWRGVPVTLQTGKRLDRKNVNITMNFSDRRGRFNTLVFRLQPDEGIELDLQAKKPGFNGDTERVVMRFSYQEAFGLTNHPDAYERVLIDGIRGDQTLFASSEEVLASWRILEAVVQEWAKSGEGLTRYAPGADPAGI
jgi:glucose-6-phosphate 1-dehydrogenase